MSVPFRINARLPHGASNEANGRTRSLDERNHVDDTDLCELPRNVENID